MLRALGCVIQRDLLIAFRRRSDVLSNAFFFLIVVTLFPLSVGPEPSLLLKIAPGILWVAALLASMLALNRLFASDYLDGTLEQMLLSPEPLSVFVIGKIIAHWLVAGLPLVLLAPILALQFHMSGHSILILFLSLLLGTPALSLIGAIGASLTIGVRGGGILLSLLVLPLYVPVLIFGAGAVEAEMNGMGSAAYLLLLGGTLATTMALAPWAIAAGLRISLE